MDERFGMVYFFKFVLDGNLKLLHFVGILRLLNLLGNFGGIIVHTSFVKSLGMIELVLTDFRVEF